MLSLAVLVDEQEGHRLASLRGVGVALAYGDDRALHEDVEECARDSVSRRTASSARRRTNERICSRSQMLASPAGCSGAEVEQDVDERARLEVFAVKPLVEHVEDREQPLLGVSAAADSAGFDEALGPALFPEVQEREHELVLGGEVRVERRDRDAGALDDLVNPDRADSALGEQLVGGIQNLLPSASACLRRSPGFKHERTLALERALYM
jgi:hypothetical protein